MTFSSTSALAPRNILIAPDKFKGSARADEIADTAAAVLAGIFPDAKIQCLPISDGGDGFTKLLTSARGGNMHSFDTTDPLGRPVTASYGVVDSGSINGTGGTGGATALVDLAEASGIRYLTPAERNPLHTSNEGTGRLLAHLVESGFREIIIGLGGSATTEGGIGLVAPLGYQFLDAADNAIPLTGAGCGQLARIIPPPSLPEIKWTVATDVVSPLLGAAGAARQFGPQKGASAEEIETLEQHLQQLVEIAQRDIGGADAVSLAAGAGAAGGCGFGLMALLHAQAVSGFDYFAQHSGLASRIHAADLILTGEGCYDATSAAGKGPGEIARRARDCHKPVWLLCGRCTHPGAKSDFAEIIELSSVAPDTASAIREPLRYLKQALQDKFG